MTVTSGEAFSRSASKLYFLNATVADDGDAKVLQVLGRQVRQNLLGYLVLGEYGLVLFEAQAPQLHDVHDGRPYSRNRTELLDFSSLDDRREVQPQQIQASDGRRCHKLLNRWQRRLEHEEVTACEPFSRLLRLRGQKAMQKSL